MGQEISMDDYESDSSLQSILQCEYINYHLFCTRAIKMYMYAHCTEYVHVLSNLIITLILLCKFTTTGMNIIYYIIYISFLI